MAKPRYAYIVHRAVKADDATNTVTARNKSSRVAEMGDRLATIIDMGRKVGATYCAPFGGAVSPSNTI